MCKTVVFLSLFMGKYAFCMPTNNHKQLRPKNSEERFPRRTGPAGARSNVSQSTLGARVDRHATTVGLALTIVHRPARCGSAGRVRTPQPDWLPPSGGCRRDPLASKPRDPPTTKAQTSRNIAEVLTWGRLIPSRYNHGPWRGGEWNAKMGQKENILAHRSLVHFISVQNKN